MKENGPRLRRWRSPRIRHYREYPSGDFSKPSRFFYKWHLIIKDVPSEQQIPERTKTSQTEGEGGGGEFYFSLTETENMEPWFSWLLGTAASTKPIFASF